MSANEALTSSLEDYLEAIFLIVEKKGAARAKDISDRLRVNSSSVTGALHALSDRELVNYAPYDVITLTATGEEAAREVVRRHEALRDFFVKVLAVSGKEAEEAACKIEHGISRTILERFIRFVEYVDRCPLWDVQWTEEFGFRCEQEGGPPHPENPGECERCVLRRLRPDEAAEPVSENASTTSPLATMESGSKVRLVSVQASRGLQARLASMGLVPGVEFEVIRRSKSGPFIVSVKGSRVMLGRGMAHKIMVS